MVNRPNNTRRRKEKILLRRFLSQQGLSLPEKGDDRPTVDGLAAQFARCILERANIKIDGNDVCFEKRIKPGAMPQSEYQYLSGIIDTPGVRQKLMATFRCVLDIWNSNSERPAPQRDDHLRNIPDSLLPAIRILTEGPTQTTENPDILEYTITPLQIARVRKELEKLGIHTFANMQAYLTQITETSPLLEENFWQNIWELPLEIVSPDTILPSQIESAPAELQPFIRLLVPHCTLIERADGDVRVQFPHAAALDYDLREALRECPTLPSVDTEINPMLQFTLAFAEDVRRAIPPFEEILDTWKVTGRSRDALLLMRSHLRIGWLHGKCHLLSPQKMEITAEERRNICGILCMLTPEKILQEAPMPDVAEFLTKLRQQGTKFVKRLQGEFPPINDYLEKDKPQMSRDIQIALGPLIYLMPVLPENKAAANLLRDPMRHPPEQLLGETPSQADISYMPNDSTDTVQRQKTWEWIDAMTAAMHQCAAALVRNLECLEQALEPNRKVRPWKNGYATDQVMQNDIQRELGTAIGIQIIIEQLLYKEWQEQFGEYPWLLPIARRAAVTVAGTRLQRHIHEYAGIETGDRHTEDNSTMLHRAATLMDDEASKCTVNPPQSLLQAWANSFLAFASLEAAALDEEPPVLPSKDEIAELPALSDMPCDRLTLLSHTRTPQTERSLSVEYSDEIGFPLRCTASSHENSDHNKGVGSTLHASHPVTFQLALAGTSTGQCPSLYNHPISLDAMPFSSAGRIMASATVQNNAILLRRALQEVNNAMAGSEHLWEKHLIVCVEENEQGSTMTILHYQGNESGRAQSDASDLSPITKELLIQHAMNPDQFRILKQTTERIDTNGRVKEVETTIKGKNWPLSVVQKLLDALGIEWTDQTSHSAWTNASKRKYTIPPKALKNDSLYGGTLWDALTELGVPMEQVEKWLRDNPAYISHNSKFQRK